ncbi:hypothetical protein SBRCBS47491_002472 [Sporothrix bragantina]|uniref:Uncharacterized protein n=1 Tax=Sporothrix bragantina TaxID=671064 RepID=A0ABP0B793_9PEZI
MASRLPKDVKPDPSPPPSSSSSPNPNRASQRKPPAPTAMAVTVDTSAARLMAPTGSDAGEPRMLTPPPQSARTELASRIDEFALNSPLAERSNRRGDHHQPPPPPGKTPGTQSSLFAQNRAILLSGLPQSPVSHESTSPQSPARSGSQQQQRRNLTPLVTAHPPSAHLRSHYPQYYEHTRSAVGPNAPPSPLQSPRTYSRVIRVKAVPFGHRPRRGSAASTRSAQSTNTADKQEDGSSDVRSEKVKDTTTTTVAELKREAGLTPPPEGQLQVSAYIVPPASDRIRKVFHLQRDFDLQALLEAVPRPPPEASVDRRYRSSISILASPVASSAPSPLFPPARTPLSARPPTSANERGPPGAPPPTPVTAGSNYSTGMKRPASDHSPNTSVSPHPNLRRQAAKHGRQASQTSQRELPPADQILKDGSVLIPILPHPSLGGLPALAAIILSRFAKVEDVIELPLPHPDAWGPTISYIYRSRGELTDHVRENIEYLGGKCE